MEVEAGIAKPFAVAFRAHLILIFLGELWVVFEFHFIFNTAIDFFAIPIIYNIFHVNKNSAGRSGYLT
jgi:hypothetical protein